MSPEHAAPFELALADVLDLYGVPHPSAATLCLWWAPLEPFPWSHVQRALQDHVARCKFAPKPADILERLETSDGRPSADEAWSTALAARDEAATLVWTPETAEAWGIAAPVLAIGDEVGARRAFIDAYSRLVMDARRALIPAAWTVSLGTDPRGRALALGRAVERRQLPRARAQALVPALEAPDHGMRAVAGLLAGDVAALPEVDTSNARRFLAIVKDAIAQSGEQGSVRRQARAAERRRKVEAVEALERFTRDRA